VQGAEIGERSAAAGERGGGDRENVDDGSAIGMKEPSDPFGGVDHGVGIGHAADGSEASGGRGSGASGDSFLVGLTGLSQMNVEVDKPGGDDEAAGVEFIVRAAASFIGKRNFDDSTVAEQDVH